MCDPLIELIDDIVLMYHVGAHKQLRKMSTLRENMQVRGFVRIDVSCQGIGSERD